MLSENLSRSHLILMSTLILPGLGQCAMKKWTAGLGYALGFIIAVVLFFMTLAIPLIKNLMILTDFGSNDEVSEVSWPRALFFLATTLLIYIINTVDIILRTKKKVA